MNQGALEVMAVDAARELEATKKATSEMKTLAAPLENMASGVSGTDNPIAIVDGISSFLETLKKFNSVVDKIATVSITISSACLSMIIRLSRFILTRKQRGLSSLLFPRSGRCVSPVTQSNLRVADNY